MDFLKVKTCTHAQLPCGYILVETVNSGDAPEMMKRAKVEERSLFPFYPVFICINKDSIKDENGWMEGQVSLHRPAQLHSLCGSKEGWVLLSSTDVLLSIFVKGEDGQLEVIADRIPLHKNQHLEILNSPLLYLIIHEGSSVSYLISDAFDENASSLFEYDKFNKEDLQDTFLGASLIDIDDFIPASFPPICFIEDFSSVLGPPDLCHIERLLPTFDFATQLTHSRRFVKEFLEGVTGLDLSIPETPSQIWSLSPGSYRLLNGKHRDTPGGLDLYLCLNGPSDNDDETGEILYVDDESGEIVGRVKPRYGRLSLAYRTEGASRFIRYIPKSITEDNANAKFLVITYPASIEE